MPAIAAMDNETLDHLEKTCGDGTGRIVFAESLIYQGSASYGVPISFCASQPVSALNAPV